jgi:hypothetical protein
MIYFIIDEGSTVEHKPQRYFILKSFQ